MVLSIFSSAVNFVWQLLYPLQTPTPTAAATTAAAPLRSPKSINFLPPTHVPKFRDDDAPDDVTVCDFMLESQYGRQAFEKSKHPFVCAVTGKSYAIEEVRERVECLAKALERDLGWEVDAAEFEKVGAVFSLNSLDTITILFALHRLGGLPALMNAASNAEELADQIRISGAKCIFTCVPLLPTALAAAKTVGIPTDKVYILETPSPSSSSENEPSNVKLVNSLIEQGATLPVLKPFKLEKGDGAKRVAVLCFSSGTSGLPKAVMLSHKNIISSTLQLHIFDKARRKSHADHASVSPYTEIGLGLLPFSHIYGLVVIALLSIYQGDSVIVLPKFDMSLFLSSIEDFRINNLFLVPPLILRMIQNKPLLDQHDLTSVTVVTTGAAPLGRETILKLEELWPKLFLRQGYGSTEGCGAISFTSSASDSWAGSCGVLIPGFQARLINSDGKYITGYDEPGELLLKSPSLFMGYLNNEEANREMFVDGWMRTGDEAVIRVSPEGNEHVFITDRIKELIKVNGFQVAPAELEAHILTHPLVSDCAVIQVPDEESGELPKAYVAKIASVEGAEKDLPDDELKRDIQKYVELHKARYKWLKGGVEFVNTIPKSPSGKILRRFLREKEEATRKGKGL